MKGCGMVEATALALLGSAWGGASDHSAIVAPDFSYAPATKNDPLEWDCPRMDPDSRQLCQRVMALRRPSSDLIDRVEARLTRHPCVKDLSRWQRLYSFAGAAPGDPRLVDETRISFKFREAGLYDFIEERRITAPEIWVNLDHRDYELVIGYFDLRNDRRNVEHCGSNQPRR